jgi:acyl-[acyl-carrier-protein]-phospholipid O-acyltransferase/long-chain-fatty-acid--[acyl-carrier-protein] ligase
MQQMTALLALLVGQIVAGWWFDHRFHALGGRPEHAWNAALGPMCLLAGVSTLSILTSWIIPKVPAQGRVPFSGKLAISHFASLADLWRDKPLRQASFGVAFFWGFAGFINLWSVKLAKVLTDGMSGFGTLSSMFMAAASIGMALGFGFTSWLLRKRIELGWVPVAGIAMALLSLVVALHAAGRHAGTFLDLLKLPANGGPPSPSAVAFLVLLASLAFVSSIFLAPLNAWMQDRYPADKRGDLQAAVNLQNCIAGITAVLLVTGFELAAKSAHLPAVGALQHQMIFLAAACLIASFFIIRLLPADFIRILSLAAIRSLYQIQRVHPERVPATGGALLLPNHVTYADAFFISAACKRPVRFVMDEAFTATRSIRIFTEIFETVTIRRDQPLEAIREVIRALKQGDLVCLFPEGQLTRTGSLCVLQRGFELIARKAGHPLIPLWCDGSWGSIFSYERNRFFKKLPYRLKHRMSFAFGEEIPPDDANLDTVRHGLLAASTLALEGRFRGKSWERRVPHRNKIARKIFRGLDPAARRRVWINGHQIGMINAIPRGETIHVIHGDPTLLEIPGLLAAFPELFHSEIKTHDYFDAEHNGVWVGGDTLRHMIQTSQITAKKLSFYDFGSEAVKPVERAGLSHYPCLAVGGVIVTMSMPDPAPSEDSFEPQHGHKPHSWGKLLPGFHFTHRPADGVHHIHGPAAPPEGLPLPPKTTIDPENFLLEIPPKRIGYA